MTYLAGNLYPQTSIEADVWEQVYETTVTTATTSLTISGLTGDTDLEYLLVTSFIAGANTSQLLLRPNNDTGATSGHQWLRGVDSSVDAGRVVGLTSVAIGYANATGNLALAKTYLKATSGTLRVATNKNSRTITSTTVTEIWALGMVWNNTADEITSLVILSDQASGIGVGSYIALYRKRSST